MAITFSFDDADLGGADQPADDPARSPSIDVETMVGALDLLSHWWSPPLDEEVATWPGVADLEGHVRRRLRGSERRLSLMCDEPAALRDEYERLFVGPGPVPCPPYESYWRDDVSVDIRRSLMGPCVVDLQRLYGDLGLEVAPATGELPDNVAIELEALAFAVWRGVDLAVVRSLYTDHVKRWLNKLCRSVAREAELPFYRELADVTRTWLAALEPRLDPVTAGASPMD